MKTKKFYFFGVTVLFILKLCNGFAMPRNVNEPYAAIKRESLQKIESSTKSDKKNSSETRFYRHERYGPKTYAFGFEVNDKNSSNRQFRDERRFLNGTVEGSYGYLRPDGLLSVTHYTADSKTGYLSQTRTFDLENREKVEAAAQIDWSTQFRPSETTESEIFMQHPSSVDELNENTTNALKMDHNIDVNHIDLTKDLLSPTLWNIVSGTVPLNGAEGGSGGGDDTQEGNKAAKQLGFKTYEKVIPKDFAIVPFKLPEKMENANEEKSSKMKKEEEVENNENKTTTTEMVMPKPFDSNENTKNNVDWISKIVNDTRKEFLENIPNLL